MFILTGVTLLRGPFFQVQVSHGPLSRLNQKHTAATNVHQSNTDGTFQLSQPKTWGMEKLPDPLPVSMLSGGNCQHRPLEPKSRQPHPTPGPGPLKFWVVMKIPQSCTCSLSHAWDKKPSKAGLTASWVGCWNLDQTFVTYEQLCHAPTYTSSMRGVGNGPIPMISHKVTKIYLYSWVFSRSRNSASPETFGRLDNKTLWKESNTDVQFTYWE